jgi:hypothetical protein
MMHSIKLFVFSVFVYSSLENWILKMHLLRRTEPRNKEVNIAATIPL